VTAFVTRKLLQLIPMSLAISALVFFTIRLSPIDPITYSISPDASMSQERLEELRQQLGLNDPLIQQYFRWLGDVLQGDWGYSIQSGRPITAIIGDRFPATLELTVTAFFISTVLGISWGLFSAARPNGIIDYAGRMMGVLSVAVPGFFFAILLLQVFAYQLEWFNPGGRVYPGKTGMFDRLPNLVLPVVTMVFSMIGILIRYTRNSALDVMSREYIKTARSKGLSERQILFRHVMRNSLGPVLVILVFRLPLLVGGSVLIEYVFRWPGIGNVIVTSIASSDYPLVMITTMLIAIAILIASFLVDVVKAIADPRVRLG
jgi:peptide/nickel transport system permease protein